jgi:hypothetical protein
MIDLRTCLAVCTALGVSAMLTPSASIAAEMDACSSYMPALVGGPLQPQSSDVAVLRWLGNANYELNFRGKVYLFDTYYDRTSRSRPIGFSVGEVKHADFVFLSHAHFDHMSDIVPVAAQTQAKVVSAPITIETAVKSGLPQEQTIVVRGGDTLQLGDVTVDIALARHSTIQYGLAEALGAVYKIDTRPDSPEEAQHTKEVIARGNLSPDVIDKGTLAFGLTCEAALRS